MKPYNGVIRNWKIVYNQDHYEIHGNFYDWTAGAFMYQGEYGHTSAVLNISFVRDEGNNIDWVETKNSLYELDNSV